MLRDKSIEIIKSAVKFKYNAHVGRLLSIPNKPLNKIVPNRGLPIIDILKEFNSDTNKELLNYGEQLRGDILRILETLKLSDFTEEDKTVIMAFIETHCQPDLYIKRFEIMIGSINKRVLSYGHKFEPDKYRIDIPKSLCEVGAKNITRKIKARIGNDLDCIVESFKSTTNKSNSKVSIFSRFLELKPNFMGLGLNLNAIIEKISKKR